MITVEELRDGMAQLYAASVRLFLVSGFGIMAIHLARMGRAAAAAGEAMEAFNDVVWSLEHRRRIWFWRGFAGDERRLPPMRWNCAHVWWWQVGRRTGELLAGMIR